MGEDEELLQDFLVEAGEILEQLGEQLVELENSPKDNDLLNTVFRGFHTIKGGASFLALDAMVGLCHRAEDVFNVLRNGERDVDVRVMDVILTVLDVLNEQFETLRSGTQPDSADLALLQQLDALTVPGSVDAVPDGPSETDTNSPTAQIPAKKTSEKIPERSGEESDEITDAEFESLLDTLEGKGSLAHSADNPDTLKNTPVSVSDANGDDEITEEDFETLLDQLEANEKAGGGQKPAIKTGPVAEGSKSPATVSSDDDITEAEFDALLDELHGADNSVSSSGSKRSATNQSKSTKSPEGNAGLGKDTGKQSTLGNDNSAAEKKPASRPKEAATAQAETTVRVDTKRLDDIMNMVGELVLVRNRMATLEAASANEEMSKVVANLDVVTSDLQSAVMKTRMQPIKKVFGRFPRVVRDLARSLKKEVNLEMQGEDTDLDKNLVEALADPLVHLVRNAVDHGIETPEVRVANGKPSAGTVVLTAEQEGDHILLTIEDDGKGMDPDALRRAAVEKGILDEDAAARLEAKDCYNLIFSPGFSTKAEISDVSGRGVGMDVVKTRIIQLNGSVEIDSKKGKGSGIIIKVPLTLAIMPTLMVMLERQIFALPLASVNEIFHLDLTQTNTVDGQLVIMVRDKALPLFYLRHWLVNGCGSVPLPNEGHVVVVSMGAQRIGFVVDSLIGQEEVVIKPLGALLRGMRGLAGATITGDGRISLILDIPGLMQTYARRL